MQAGRFALADTVDHVVPISAGGAPFPGHDGLASYCASCHSAKTARGTEAGASRSTKPRKGCNPDGSPLDPAHPWHGKSLRAAASGPRGSLAAQLVANASQRGVAGQHRKGPILSGDAYTTGDRDGPPAGFLTWSALVRHCLRRGGDRFDAKAIRYLRSALDDLEQGRGLGFAQCLMLRAYAADLLEQRDG